jgi:ParB family chromosome partitioning protein
MSRKLARTNTGVLATAAAEREARGAGQGYGRKGPVVVEIDIDQVIPNPHQPRTHFDPVEMAALKDSIEKHGLAQPIGVQQQTDGRFQIVFGERRYRAVKDLGHGTIYAVTVSGAADELALIENMVRADLSPFEEGEAYANLMERHGYRQEDIGKMVGKDRVDISRALIISRLPAAIREEYPQHRPARYRLVEIGRLKDEAEQLAAWQALKADLARRSAADLVDADAAEQESPFPSTDGAGSPKIRRPSPDSRTAGSALPKPLAKAVAKARDTVATVRAQSLPLANIDREILQGIRDEIDAILASETSVE